MPMQDFCQDTIVIKICLNKRDNTFSELRMRCENCRAGYLFNSTEGNYMLTSEIYIQYVNEMCTNALMTHACVTSNKLPGVSSCKHLTSNESSTKECSQSFNQKCNQLHSCASKCPQERIKRKQLIH